MDPFMVENIQVFVNLNGKNSSHSSMVDPLFPDR